MKTFKEKYEIGVKKRHLITKKSDKKWVIKIIIMAFLISAVMALISELVIPNVFILISSLLIIIFIFIGIVFDIIGVAITTADSKIFHSMATKRIKGSKTAIRLINNKDKVSNFCNDVIGDICGVISGSCGLSIAIRLTSNTNYLLLTTILITSLISALTIGGKAMGKSYAVNRSNEIVFSFSKILSSFSKDK